jgi:hypothetical protein
MEGIGAERQFLYFEIEAIDMKNRWKPIGLCCSLVLEIFSWVSSLSLLLMKIGSPIADIIWLLSGVFGILFGVINLRSGKNKIIKVLSYVAIAMGVIQLPLWVLAMFVTSM